MSRELQSSPLAPRNAHALGECNGRLSRDNTLCSGCRRLLDAWSRQEAADDSPEIYYRWHGMSTLRSCAQVGCGLCCLLNCVLKSTLPAVSIQKMLAENAGLVMQVDPDPLGEDMKVIVPARYNECLRQSAKDRDSDGFSLPKFFRVDHLQGTLDVGNGQVFYR
jgi:DNA-binding transcriptional LysR family regulator